VPRFLGGPITVDAAAAKASISRTTAYRYFPNQRTLLLGGGNGPRAPAGPRDVAAIPDSGMTPLAEIIIESADSNGSEGG
jgi:hypothetical protein